MYTRQQPFSLFSGLIFFGISVCFIANYSAINSFHSYQHDSLHQWNDSLTNESDMIFNCFRNRTLSGGYTITICADIPDNSNPLKLMHNNESGHVFIIVSAQDSSAAKKTVSVPFGFYPRYMAMMALIKRVPGAIKNNWNREYDASVSKKLTAREFHNTLILAKELSKRKYHINNFNCYDYAVLLFNSSDNKDSLPVSRVKYPLASGSGGTPGCLYNDLKKIKTGQTSLASAVTIKPLLSPEQCISNN